MLFPAQAAQACDELYERNVSLARSDDDNDRRRLTRLIAEQIAFTLGDRWGCKKRAGLGDEWQSKDSIAYREDDGTVSVWDWQNGSTRRRAVNAGDQASHANLSPQEAAFMPVSATNHLDWPSGPLTAHPFQGSVQPGALCNVCQRRREEPIHEQPSQDDVAKQLRAALETISSMNDALQRFINDGAARTSRIDVALSDLRQAMQSTDDRVERTYQDLKNRIDAIRR
jgi:hypothetical protein